MFGRDRTPAASEKMRPAMLLLWIIGAMLLPVPLVVVTFGPDGACGHPDHIAISQFTTAAIVAAGRPSVSRRWNPGPAVACGVEALLPGLAGIDLDSLRVSFPEIGFDGRRH